MTASGSELALRGVHAGYGRGPDVLAGLDLRLGGGLHVLLGVNGAGKTTLFRVAAGVLPPRHGSVSLGGADLLHDPAAKRDLAYLAHRPALYPELPVADNLAFWARVLRVPAAGRAERIAHAVELAGAADLLPLRAGRLSRGQSQRAALARALLADPAVLLLDEPTTGLDPGTASRIRELVRSLAEQGRVVVYATHDLHEASDLADDLVLLDGGTLAGRGTVAELRARGAHTIRFRVDGDPRAVLDRLGHPYRRSGPGWEVTVSGDSDTGAVVASLVDGGVSVLEVSDPVNPVEAVLRGLADRPGVEGGSR